jgi:hypothetical protein
MKLVLLKLPLAYLKSFWDLIELTLITNPSGQNLCHFMRKILIYFYEIVEEKNVWIKTLAIHFQVFARVRVEWELRGGGLKLIG